MLPVSAIDTHTVIKARILLFLQDGGNPGDT